MGIFNQLIPKYIKTPDGKIIQQNVPEEIYIDDAFDPLFNKRAQEYLNYKYGNPFLGTLGGFAEGIDNALIGQKDKWGILGPGMGILSGFGRTMDKAEDFIIGGLTEGVNALNNISPIGADIKPENPLHNIFVEDEDYTGRRLLAAMGNSMSKLAGNAVLDESDFSGAWNVAGTGLELMTDPGILGGSLAKRLAPEVTKMTSKDILKNIGNAPVKHTVGEIGQLLSNYDDLMAKVAWDVTVPGLRPMLKNNIHKIHDLIGYETDSLHADVELPQYTDEIEIPIKSKNINADDITPSSPPTAAITNAVEPIIDEATGLPIPVLNNDEIETYLRGQIRELTPNLELYDKMLDDLIIKFGITKEHTDLYNAIIAAKKKLNAFKNPVEAGDIATFGKGSKPEVKKFLNEREIKYNEELSEALNTKAGRKIHLADLYSDVEGDSLLDFHIKHREDALDIIESFDVLSEIDETAKKAYKAQGLGPGYDFNLNYYRKSNGAINTDAFIKDLADGAVKNEDGAEVDDTILNYMYSKFQKAMESKGYTSPKVKVFYSSSARRNDAQIAAHFVNKRLKAFTKKYFRKDYVSVDEFLEKFKSSKHMQEILENDPALESILRYRLENVLSPRFISNKKINYHTLPTYLQNVEKLTDVLRYHKQIPGRLVIEETPFYRDLLNLSDELAEDIFEPLMLTNKSVMYPRTSYSFMGDLNNMILNSPEAFQNEFGEFDLEAFAEFRKKIGRNFEVRIMPGVSKQMYDSKASEFYFKDLENRLLKWKSMSESSDVLKTFREKYGAQFKKASQEERERLIKQHLPSDYHSLYFTHGYNTLKKQITNYKSELKRLKSLKTPSAEDLSRIPLLEKELKNLENIRKGYTFVVKDYNDILLGQYDINDVIKNLKVAQNGKFYGNDLLRFTDEAYRAKPALNKIPAEFIIDESKTWKSSMSGIFKALKNKPLAKEVVETTPMSEYVREDIVNKVVGNVSELTKTFGSEEDVVKVLATPEKKRWYQIINESMSVSKKAKGGDYATLREKRVEAILDKLNILKVKYTPEQVAEYFKNKDLLNDDIITGENFISELISSNGRILIPLNSKTQSKKIKELENIINENIIATSVDGRPLVEIVRKEIPNSDTVVLGYKLRQDSEVPKLFSKLKIDKNRLKDLVIHKSEAADLSKYLEIDEAFVEAQSITEEFSKTLGFTNFTTDYFKHVMSDSEDAAKWLGQNIYGDIDLDDLDDLSTTLANIANNNGTFRIQPLTRSLRGNFADWNQFAPIFSTDLEAIAKSTFSKGVFDNVNFQSYVDLFVNDNFKIKNYARTTEDLKKVLYAGYDKGMTGNLDNTLLVAPIYNESGRLIKFKRFDKFSEKGLAEALNNPDTILIPTSVLTPLDKILRKDARMSNKVFRFINKYLNIPFKFGTLMNPGFLAGNMGDAYFKQAVTLSKKYGTSLTEELVNVQRSLKEVQFLNNAFDMVYRNRFLKHMQDFEVDELTKNPLLHVSDIILKNKKSYQIFKDWFKTASSKGELQPLEENIIRMWLFINESQPTVFKASSELDTVLDELDLDLHQNRYEIPRSPVEKLLTGNPKNKVNSRSFKENMSNLKQDWTSYGLFANNPLSAEIIKSSNAIETYFRSACILNDLKHNYGSMDEITEILNNFDFKEIGYEESMEALNIKMMEAVNTMHSANFDYNNVTDLLDTAGTVIPFPTFFMKNLGYWLEIMIEKPQLIDNMINVQTGLWGDRDLSEDEFQAEAAGRGAIPMTSTGIPEAASIIGGQKLSNLFKGIYKPSPMNSMFGAFNLLNNPVEDIAFRVNPALTPITRHLQDEESVRYRPYSTNQYERNITPKDENFSELALMFHRLNPMERTINTGLRTPGKIVKGEAQLSDFAPSLFQPDF